MIPVSVCIIAKNEEKNMERFLSCLRKYDWEIIVVDTGSTDRTKEIAQKYADQVADFQWIDDFSAARNFSISLATHDFILVLDCDEFLIDIDLDAVLRLAHDHAEQVGCIQLQNHIFSNNCDTIVFCSLNRFFNKNFYHYTSRVHEQTTRIDNSPMPAFYQLPITLDHQGYNMSDQEKVLKAERDRNLLLKELEDYPDDAYLLFQTGQSYFFIHDYEQAVSYYAQAIGSPSFNPDADYTIHLLLAYGNSLLDIGKSQEALNMEKVDYLLSAYGDYYCLMGRIYFENKMYLKSMMAFIQALNCEKEIHQGARSNIPHYNMGYLNEKLGDIQNAVMQYKMCQDFPMAAERLKELQK